ncbi:MAG: hypothetical protein WA555_00805 [Candidatus Sulfotelmatobacter sp.]
MNPELQKYLIAHLLRNIPKKYQEFRLDDVQPSDKSRLPLEEQAALFAEMKEHTLDGWAFFAPAGYSKTVCSTVLYRRAVWANMIKWWNEFYIKNHFQSFEWPPHAGDFTIRDPEIPRIFVWKKSVPDLLQQHFDMFNAEDREVATKPDITAEKIQEGIDKGFTPRVFLEEIDKVKPSEFSINQIFRLFDVIDRNGCQLVIDTNLSTAQFTDMFGEPIARRVKENCRIKEYGF